MKTYKRLCSLLLAICLLLSMAAPAVFAEETAPETSEKVTVTYSFGFESLSGTQKNGAANPESEIAFNSDPKCGYLNISTNRGFTAGTTSILARYNEASFNDGAWMAVKLSDVAAGTYDMTFDLGPGATNGGLAKVYVVKSDAYASAVAQYLGTLQSGKSLTKEENEAFFAALNTDGSVLNAGNEAVLDCYKCDALVKEQSIGEVTFPESGEYVLVFQCAGSSSNNTAGTAYQFQLLKLNMTMEGSVQEEEKNENEEEKEDVETEKVTATYSFGFESLSGTQKNGAANPESESAFNSDPKCGYLNISTNRGFTAGTTSILARYNEASFNDGA